MPKSMACLISKVFIVSLIGFWASVSVVFGQDDELCVRTDRPAGLTYRFDENDAGPFPNLVLDMSTDVPGQIPNQIGLTLVENPGEYFVLEEKQLRLQRPIDRDEDDLTQLELRLVCAYYINGNGVSREIPITVLVEDINDNAPVFMGQPYAIQLPELTPVNTVVFTGLRADDLDAGPNSQIQFALLRGAGVPLDVSSYFRIDDPTTGEIILDRPVDHEIASEMELIVIAVDNPEDPTTQRSSNVTIIINVTDADDNGPHFVHPDCVTVPCEIVIYQTDVPAGVDPPTSSLALNPTEISAVDTDRGQRNAISYSFGQGVPSDFSRYFTIDPNTGGINQVASVPFAVTDRFTIDVVATELSVNGRQARASLRIDIDNQLRNLYAPELLYNSLVGYINEESEIGTTVRVDAEPTAQPLQVQVQDQDLQPGMPDASYAFILTGDGSQLFAINQGGFVYLNREASAIDADSGRAVTYNLTLQAREIDTNPIRSSDPVTLLITVINLNDNVPQFDQPVSTVVVPANAGFQTLLEIKATDQDSGLFGDLIYSILSVTNDGQRLFQYDAQQNVLVALTGLPAATQYQVTLEARDGGDRAAQAMIVINVEADTTTIPVTTFAPTTGVFDRTTPNSNSGLVNVVPVNETVPVGYAITQLLATTDNPGAIEYRILSGNEEGRFIIGAQTGIIRTRLTLDYESTPRYILVVEAADRSGSLSNTTTITIEVVDMNDNPPRIQNNGGPITFTVKDQESNAVVGTVQATDADSGFSGQISYQLETQTDLFVIDRSTGEITTTRALTRNDRSQYELTIIAQDSGSPPLQSTATVTVTVLPSGDQLPYFPQTQYSVNVLENLGPVALVTVEAVDPDADAQITYVLRQGDPTLFAVDEVTGIVSTLRELDAERNLLHTVMIGTLENAEETESSLATISVNVKDVNDWMPTFQPLSYQAEVLDSANVGALVAQVSAIDDDYEAPNNLVSYQFVGPSDILPFFTMEGDGRILVAQPLTPLAGQQIAITVEVIDGGQPPMRSTGTVDLRVVASTTSERVTTTIAASSTEAVVLSSEAPTLEATRPTQSTTQAIRTFPPTIPTLPPAFNNIQFTTPEYRSRVLESARPPQFVVVLPLRNKPFSISDVQCSIVSGNPDGNFGVAVNTRGDCEINVISTLDREVIDSYFLNVSVSAPSVGRPGFRNFDYSTVEIKIDDINDNPPVFVFAEEGEVKPAYYGGLAIDAPVLSKGWLKVQAVDNDIAENAKIVYTLDSQFGQGHSRYFQINSTTGEIENLQALQTIVKQNSREPLKLLAVASDAPIQQKNYSTTASVIINAIRDQNRFQIKLKGAWPERAREYEKDILKYLKQEAGLCRIIKVENYDKDDSTDNMNAIINYYAINVMDDTICSRADDDMVKLLSDKTFQLVKGQLASYFTVQYLGAPAPLGKKTGGSGNGVRVAGAAPGSDWDWGAAQIALVVLGCVILLGAIIGIVVLCFFFNKYKRSKVYTSQPKPNLYAMLPKTYNALLLPPSEKEYETQMLEMPMGDDSPHKDGVDLGFTVQEGVYSIRPALSASHLYQPPIQQPYRNGRATSLSNGPAGVVIPPPDYPPSSADSDSNGRRNGRRTRHEKTTML